MIIIMVLFMISSIIRIDFKNYDNKNDSYDSYKEYDNELKKFI